MSSVGTFVCAVCHISEKCHYYGCNPPFAKGITFTEDAYVAKDPFAPKEQRLFLMLGSHCAVCNKIVCQSQNCSIYYSKRFCIDCAKTHILKFPEEIQKEISKLKKNG